MVTKVFCDRGFPLISWRPILNYLEVCYILLNVIKPTDQQYDEFKTTGDRHTMIHEQITRLFHAFRRDSHPMAVDAAALPAEEASPPPAPPTPRHRDLPGFAPAPRRPWPRCVTSIPLGQPLVICATISSYAGNFLNISVSTPRQPDAN